MLNYCKFCWKSFQSADTKGIAAGLAAHSGQISVGLSQGFSAILIPKLLETNFASTIEASWIASLGVISNPLGALIAGSTAECFGRRAAIALATLPHAAGWLFIALSTNISMLYIGRFISGIGTGMANALYLYVTEVAAPHQRAWLASSGPILVSFGVLCSYALGALTTWQSTAALSIGPAILSLVLTRLIPESPAWLARRGRFAEAQESLVWLRGPGIACENEYKELCCCSAGGDGAASIEAPRWKKSEKINLYNAILRPNVWKPFCILFVFFGIQQLSGIYIILFYAVNVLKDISGSDDENIDEYVASIGIGLIRLVAAILGAICARHYGRRTLACASAAGMAVSAISVALAMSYINNNNTPQIAIKWFPIVCIGTHVGFSMIGYLSLPWVMTSELYPLRFRGIMGGLTTGIAQIMTFTTIKMYPEINNLIGLKTFMLIFGISSIFGVIFSLTILPETNGRSLEEIEREFSTAIDGGSGSGGGGGGDSSCLNNDNKVFSVDKFMKIHDDKVFGCHNNVAYEHEEQEEEEIQEKVITEKNTNTSV